MANNAPYRLYALMQTTPTLLERYLPAGLDLNNADPTAQAYENPERRAARLETLGDFTRKLLRSSGPVSSDLLNSFTVVAAPSFDWVPAFVEADNRIVIPPNLIITYTFDDPKLLQDFNDTIYTLLGIPLLDGNSFIGVGADPGGTVADHWCPGAANLAKFGHRRDARQLINAQILGNNGLRGGNVNVVIIDEGLDKNLIPPANWGGGLNYNSGKVLVGTAAPNSHGMLIARNVLDLAPDAVLYDVPLLPERIVNDTAFASQANVVFQILLGQIQALRLKPKFQGPWILVNAWAIFDRATENPLGDYTENLNTSTPGGHPLNNVVALAVGGDSFDVIFAAGNCGQFCPSRRCGPLDRGPGHSIRGANAHPAVITAGAVRTDELWLGYSSQGEGPPKLAIHKPDFCAPSQFCDDLDASAVNSGTSTACAVTAGVVAALRSKPAWNQIAVPPANLKQALIAGTRKTLGPAWNNRLGNGVLDVGGTFPLLP